MLKSIESLFTRLDNLIVDLFNQNVESVKEFSVWKYDCMLLKITKIDHIAWVSKIVDAYNGSVHLELTTISDDHQCRLGKWYYNEGMNKYKDNIAFKELEGVHQLVHAKGAEIVNAVNNKDMEKAKSLLSELLKYKDIVLSKLDTLIDSIGEDINCKS